MNTLQSALKAEENQINFQNDQGIKIKQLDDNELANCVLYKQFSYTLNHLLRVITKNDESYRYKMHLGLCRMLEFNELELVYWHLLNLQFDYGKKLQPNFQQEIKTSAFNYFKDFLKIQAEFIPDISLYKRELLFMTLTAFYSIKILRNIQKFERIGEFIKEEKFIELFKRIEPAFQNISNQLSLYIVNQKYMELTKFEEPLEEQQTNYNSIVEQILEMAPAYQKDEEIPITKKVKRQKKLMLRQTETIQKIEQDQSQKIDFQPAQSQIQDQYDQNFINQSMASMQFSRQFNPIQQSQIQQNQDQFMTQERTSFQQYDRQHSYGMQLRSRIFNTFSQESLGQQFSNQQFFGTQNDSIHSKNMKSSQWKNCK